MINLKFVNAFGRKEICGEWLIREPRPSRLYYAHSGICNFMYQGTMVTLEPGYLYLIPFTITFQPHSDQNHPFDHSYSDFESVPPIISDHIFKLDPNMTPMIKSTCNIFLQITEKANTYYYPTDVDKEVFALLEASVTFLVKQFIDYHKIQMPNDKLAISIMNELLNHIDRDITIHDIAKKYYMSPDAIIRRFKRSFHTTPYAYLKELRLRTATQLIQAGEKLNDVALATNYTSASSLLHALNSNTKYVE